MVTLPSPSPPHTTHLSASSALTSQEVLHLLAAPTDSILSDCATQKRLLFPLPDIAEEFDLSGPGKKSLIY